MFLFSGRPVTCRFVFPCRTFFGPDKYGKVIDDTWIIQERHGPFRKENAPKSHFGSGKKGKSLDHWEGIIVPNFKLWEESDERPDTQALPNGWVWRDRVNADFLKEFATARWENAEEHARRRLVTRG